jgi:hypothetical protein
VRSWLLFSYQKSHAAMSSRWIVRVSISGQ